MVQPVGLAQPSELSRFSVDSLRFVDRLVESGPRLIFSNRSRVVDSLAHLLYHCPTIGCTEAPW